MTYNKQVKILYEIVFIILSLTAVTITILDIIETINLETDFFLKAIDETIMYVFIADYIIRLLTAKNKRIFVKSNIPDLIAIIPFTSIFKVFRIAKILKVARLAKMTKLLRLIAVGSRLLKRTKRILRTNGLNKALWFTAAVILLGSLGIYVAEKGQTIDSFFDAVWWSFVTATTVGYGDISPATSAGRLIAGVLMITGIGAISMITSAISTYFINGKDQKLASVENDSLKRFIMSSNELSDNEKSELINYIDFLKSKR
ncbi:potassium channel family protein [Bacteroides heparinolyticus]|uniref:potassium channel family protein n=1 Tax=Prevotella heparinolytica TaxID=28113 RepID=UPI00359F9194